MGEINTNCLAGMQCPKCGSNEPFGIEIMTTMVICDDGSHDTGDLYWDKDSYCTCLSCDFDGKVAAFETEHKL